MSIFEKVTEIYSKFHLCLHCLGRMYALLGTETSNSERGYSILLTLTLEHHHHLLGGNKEEQESALQTLSLLAKNAKFLPAKKVLEKEGKALPELINDEKCYLCQDMFLDLEKYVQRATDMIKGYEFKNLLVGTTPDSEIINREDKFKADFNLLEAESFKSHFNRAVGKRISETLDKPPEFDYPDVVFIYNIKYDSFVIEPLIRSIYVKGRYQKLVRGIPQTRWPCRKCGGKGCEGCDFTGKQYPTSVEQLISPEFVKDSQASESKFHGAGREDIDVRMLGTGRPFILELKSPKVRDIDLSSLMIKVNELNKDKIFITDLKFSDKQDVIKIKEAAENTRKIYKALVESSNELDQETFQKTLYLLKEQLEQQQVNQRTPFRVAHRRADLTREKKIYSIEGKYLSPTQFEFIIETQGGTYIKELISGDEGRTKPSFTDIFGFAVLCKELDVLQILS